jgi:hypothetical protein
MRSSAGILLLAVMASGCSRGWDEFAVAADAGVAGSSTGGAGGTAGSSTGGAPSGGSGGASGAPQSCNTCTPEPCECAPAVPDPWAPARFAELGKPGTEPPCSGGWTSVGSAGVGLKDTGCTSCQCVPKDTGCVAQVTWYENTNCGQPAGSSSSPGPCATPPLGINPSSFEVVYKPPQTSCVSDAKPNPPAFDQSFSLCVAEVAPADPSCGMCIPTAGAPLDPARCVLKSSASSEDVCPAGYPVRYELGTAADIQDNRTCTGCTCGPPTDGTCNSGSIAACTAKACAGCGPGIPPGSCAQGQSANVSSPPPATGVTCTGGGVAVTKGTLTLNPLQLLCCET